jgi:transcriptional regulator with XRE-family HTH domain
MVIAMTLIETIATRLRALRIEKGYTCDRAAKAIGYKSGCQVSQIESPNKQNIHSLQTLLMLADFYGVSLDYLCGRTEERNFRKRNL